jgi:hypothetical protein
MRISSGTTAMSWKEQDAHHLAAMRLVEFETLGEQFGEHRRRGHGQRATERDAFLPAELQGSDDGGDHGDGHQDLQQAETEDDALHRVQLGQRELEADREHQEDDAELGQMLHAADAADQIERMRADHRADQQIAEHRRQVDGTENDHRNHRGAEQHHNCG